MSQEAKPKPDNVVVAFPARAAPVAIRVPVVGWICAGCARVWAPEMEACTVCSTSDVARGI
jgi:hypothetical protein